MDLNFAAFQEPRGVMRILHFVFSICAFATITSYAGYIRFKCSKDSPEDTPIEFSYPFSITQSVVWPVLPNNSTCTATVNNDFSSDAKFFVATGVLSMLYCIAIIVVYLKMDEAYKKDKKFPLYDFAVTVFLAVLWLSSSAAWANGLTGLKSATGNPGFVPEKCCETYHTTSYSTLNISVIFGFLNFFLWAADLWFLYKETAWFQGNQPQTDGGV